MSSMQKRPNVSVRYQKVASSPDEGFVDAQPRFRAILGFPAGGKISTKLLRSAFIMFRRPIPKVPWKAICLAMFLFAAGTVLLVIGSLLFTGYIDVEYADRTYPMLILGTLLFIPGFYHVGIAYFAWRGYKGYSYDDIPDFD